MIGRVKANLITSEKGNNRENVVWIRVCELQDSVKSELTTSPRRSSCLVISQSNHSSSMTSTYFRAGTTKKSVVRTQFTYVKERKHPSPIIMTKQFCYIQHAHTRKTSMRKI